jgi:copper(I)-binding protein
MPDPIFRNTDGGLRVLGRDALAGLLVLLGTSLGCGAAAPDTEPAPKAAATLEIQRPRVHLMPGMGAAYMSIVNAGDVDERLVSIETTAAQAAETHETLEDNGVLRMVAHPDGFEIPAHSTLDLEPGGKHVMLVEPRLTGDGEDNILLTLHFERAGTITVEAPLMTLDEMEH